MDTKRNVGLDIVRACAILPVLVVHFSSQIFDSTPVSVFVLGNFGVEIFFVLSGFLIGGIILRDFTAPFSKTIAWTFYVRRWLRTIPLYVTFFLPSMMLTSQGFTPANAWSSHSLMYLVFLQNLAWPMVSSRYPESWSLAVEEWFYLIFPVLFAFVPLKSSIRRVFVIALVLIVCPLVLRIVTYAPEANWDEEIRKVVVLRIDAIAYGILAIWFVHWKPQLAQRWRWGFCAAGMLGLSAGALILAGGIAPGPVLANTLLFSILSASFACIVIWASRIRPVPPRTVGALIYWTSTRSFALYLCHLTILRGMKVLGLAQADLVISLPFYAVGCAALAEAAHRLVERPFMRLRPAMPHPGPGSAPAGTGGQDILPSAIVSRQR